MHSLSKLTIAGFAAFTLAACSGNSQTAPAGSMCPANYDPTPMKIGGSQKSVPTDPQQNKSAPADSQMPPGIYTYELSDLTYTQKGLPAGQTPIQIQVHDQSAKQSVVCLRGAKTKMQVPPTEFDAVTDVIVCDNYNQIIRTRHYSFDITNGKISFATPKPKDYCLTSTATVAEKDEQMFIRDDSVKYQWRRSHTDDVANWIVSVRMNWSKFPGGVQPQECQKCEPPPTTPTPTPATPPKK